MAGKIHDAAALGNGEHKMEEAQEAASLASSNAPSTDHKPSESRNAKEALATSPPGEEVEYPPMRKVIVIVVALYLSILLVALVCFRRLLIPIWLVNENLERLTRNVSSRTGPSSLQQSLGLRTNSTRSAILAGTAAPTCLRVSLFSSSLAGSTPSMIPKLSSSTASAYLKSGPLSAVLRLALWHL